MTHYYAWQLSPISCLLDIIDRFKKKLSHLLLVLKLGKHNISSNIYIIFSEYASSISSTNVIEFLTSSANALFSVFLSFFDNIATSAFHLVFIFHIILFILH